MVNRLVMINFIIKYHNLFFVCIYIKLPTQNFGKDIAWSQILEQVVSPAGEHLLTEDRHYLTSGKNESVQILIKST